MFENFGNFVLFCLAGYLVVSVLYSIFLATVSIFYCEKKQNFSVSLKKIAIIVPAHNEDLIIKNLLDNLEGIDYDDDLYETFIIADNCTDDTVKICLEKGFKVFERKDLSDKGKGFAIKYAFEKINLDSYDSVLIIDADTFVKPDILFELSRSLSSGNEAIQCYINIPNRTESWFTEILSVSRVINGIFYHYPKSVLGLSSYLMGSGICFSTNLIKKRGWTAFSIAEDWEYYAQLLLDGYRIEFVKDAVVYQHESKSLKQATSQRLRWSSGRWSVTKTLGVKLFIEGIKKKNIMVLDSSFPLLFPNLSMQLNLTFLLFILSLVFSYFFSGSSFVYLSIVLILIQGLYFFAGTIVSGPTVQLYFSLFLAPVFLVWKAAIDFLCFVGLYKGKEWVRTERHIKE